LGEAIGAEPGLGVDIEGFEDGGAEIFGGDRAFANPGSGIIRGAIDEATGESGAGQHSRVAVGPVIAADGRGATTDAGCPSKFANEDHEGGFEESAVFEVCEEGGDGGIGSGECPAESIPAIIENSDAGIAMHIPGFDADEFVIGGESHPGDDVDESDAGFDESSGEEQILAEGVESVPFPHFGGFAFHLKRGFGLGAVKE
jgi:hypothetical protein